MSDLAKHYRQLLGIAKGWAQSNLPGWCDDLHRNLLAKHGAVAIEGRVSASSMNMPQLAAALEDYERRGWPRQRQFTARGKQAPAKVSPQISQIVKLWGALDKAGKLKNPSRAGMLAFCAHHVKRQITKLDDLNVGECQSVIEALKAWSRR